MAQCPGINSAWHNLRSHQQFVGAGQKGIPLLYRHLHIARSSSLRLCEEIAEKIVT